MNIFFSSALCVIAGTLPYRVLSYYPVRDRLRVPVWIVILFLCTSELLEAALYGFCTATGGPARAVELCFAPMCMLIYFFCVRADVFRLLFLYLFITDYVLIGKGLTMFLEAHFFYSPGMSFSTLRSAVIHLAVFAVTAPFMYLFFKRTKEQVFRTEAPKLWKTIWLVPALTTLMTLVFTYDIEPEATASFHFLFARVSVLICVMVVYFVLLQALDTIRAQAAAEEKSRQQEQMLALQRSQFVQLKRHMEETRHARHDLRQHLNLIQAYLDGDNKTALQAYITAYGKNLPQDTEHSYCKNYATDIVIRYYAEEARKSSADFFCQTNLPEMLPIDEPEFCALLGNLLENAVDACHVLQGDVSAFIRLHILLDGEILSLTVDNTCLSAPKKQDGRLLSTRHAGFGTGTQSVCSIAEKYHGSAVFEWTEGEFRASVFLQLPD